MTEYVEKWVRYYATYRGSRSEYFWVELDFPKGNTTNENNEFFRENYVQDLVDKHSYGNGCGITWEFRQVPRHIVEYSRNDHRNRLEGFRRALRNVEDKLRTNNYPIVNTNVERTCKYFPACGCMVQNKDKECRPPIQHLRDVEA